MGMLTKRKQRRFLAEKEQQWLDQLEAFGDSHDNEALHRLRVELKKIRALVKLIDTGSGKRAANHFRGLKQMFREAGKVRDAASQAQWLEQRNLMTPMEREQRAASMRAAADLFASHLDGYRQNGQKASRRLRSDVHSIHAARIRRWFAREVLEAGVMLSRQGPEMHDARKKLKTILYVHKLLPSVIRQRIPLNTDYLDQLQDAIGQWHDAIVLHDQEAGEGSPAAEQIAGELRDKVQIVNNLANGFATCLHWS